MMHVLLDVHVASSDQQSAVACSIASSHEEGRDEKINPQIVMDEELVQIDVMGGKFVKNFVMDAKNDPKL